MPRSSAKKAPAKPATATPAALWLSPEQAELGVEIAQRAGIEVVRVGCDGRGGHGSDLAKRFECEADESLRTLLLAEEPRLFLVTRLPDGEPGRVLDDPETLRRLRERGARVATLDAAPASLLDLARRGGDEPLDPLRFVPLFRRSSGGRAMASAQDHFGRARVAAFTAISDGAASTLGARLLDAMDLMLATLGVAETVDGCVHGPRSRAGLQLQPGESVRGLRGDMTAHLRYADGASATLTLSDRAGRWFRGLSLHGDAGSLRVVDDAMEWISPAGEVQESFTARTPSRDAPGAVAQELASMLDTHAPPEAPMDMRRTLAMAEAALLSARTGQPESPATVLRMSGLQ